MILVLTNSADATADHVCQRLRQHDSDFIRLDTDQLTRTARFSGSGEALQLVFDGRTLKPDDVSAIWLRRPTRIEVLASDQGEAAHTSFEWSEALEGFLACIPADLWINHPASNAGASHKLEQLRRATRHGLRIPTTLLTQDAREARAFASNHPGTIVKPLSGGYIERDIVEHDTQVFTCRVEPDMLEYAHLVESCPTFFQEEIRKRMDVRVTVIDHRITALALERKAQDGGQIVDIRRDNMSGVSYHSIPMPADQQRGLLSLLDSYSLRFAAVDFAIDEEGRWTFFEINPGGQWAWTDLLGVSDIASDMVKALARE